MLTMEEQIRGFQYVVNAEGHGGWADRLYQLLLSPQLVLAQDRAHAVHMPAVARVGPPLSAVV